ncbi:cysteine-rich CWC family protein [Polynucleobacter sp. 30F-ANTBAC]|uniref:cysteine-rich CWC family protein n=1 Tax=Polynucleobacter sp. 30F-ANTBAC TaxID=2689095 RepID=UPI001C0AA039|nr:cysteine-rich CWC family protein [Polynucleobacter sp. 30F-ANTBAC]MBU3598920.1 cysteine-rich CWC family protein [Polynucleobacter sp. 30F-ANTBAC]
MTTSNQTCFKCGLDFYCQSLAGETTCWCMALPALPKDQVSPDQGCLCQKCLKEQTDNQLSKLPIL